MNKQWKNFGIFALLLVIILVIIFFVLPNFSPTQEKLTLDQGYEKILTIFEQNDVNLENLQEMKLVNISEGPNFDVVWIEKKENVLKLKEDLVNFKEELYKKNIEKEDLEELSSIVTIFIKTIDYSLTSESQFNEIKEIVGSNSLNCTNLNVFSDVNSLLYENFYLLEELDYMNADFIVNYDLNSSPLNIDSDVAYSSLLLNESVFDDVKSNCEGGNN